MSHFQLHTPQSLEPLIQTCYPGNGAAVWSLHWPMTWIQAVDFGDVRCLLRWIGGIQMKQQFDIHVFWWIVTIIFFWSLSSEGFKYSLVRSISPGSSCRLARTGFAKLERVQESKKGLFRNVGNKATASLATPAETQLFFQGSDDFSWYLQCFGNTSAKKWLQNWIPSRGGGHLYAFRTVIYSVFSSCL